MAISEFLQTVPVVLGPLGTVLLSIYGFAASVISIYLYWRSNEASHLRSALQTSQSECQIYKGQAERLRGENQSLQTSLQEKERTIGELQVKTDVTAIVTATTDILQMSRTAIQDIEKAHGQIIKMLKESGDKNEAAFERVELLLRSVETVQGQIVRRMDGQYEAILKLTEGE